MGDEMLASVCELAFDVAKEGGAPSAMKNYLYLAQRPPRAYSVAQRALEEDATFRSRVAERATPEGVGEAGYLWLQRPSGWEHRLSEISPSGTPVAPTPLAERPPMPEPPLTASPAPAPQTPAPQAPAPAPTVSSIEDELSSLRGLVDRLADERQNVRSSVSDLEEELETRRAENFEMSTRLSALRTELVTVQDTETDVVAGRDAAFARIEELEADVAALSADLERAQTEAAGSGAERDAAMTDLAAVTAERDVAMTDLASAAAERDELSATVASLQADIEASDAQIGELAGSVERMTATKTEFEETTEQLTSDNTELAGRLVVAEQARIDLEAQLEEVSEKWQASARQLATYSGVNDQLDATVGERDALREHLARATDGITQLRAIVGTQHHQLSDELADLEQVVANGPEAPAERSAPVVDADAEVASGAEDSIDPDEFLVVDDPFDSDAGSEPEESFAADEPFVTEELSGAEAPFGADEPFGIEESFDTDSETDVVSDASLPFGDDEGSSGGGESFEDQLIDEVSGDAQLSEIFGEEDDIDDDAPVAASHDLDSAMDSEAVDAPAADTEAVDFDAEAAEVDTADEPAAGGRRRIATPGNLSDEESIARHVITVPDVVLLIDGDGVAGLGWPHLDVAARRDALGRYLGALTADSGAAADVVFQRAVGGEDSLPVSRAVRVRIADDAVATSSIITTIVDGYPEEWPIAIVTDESAVAEQADDLNVTHLTNGQLLDLFLHLNADQ